MSEQFFRLKSPDYRSDEEEDAQNPVTSTPRYFVPGVICTICGRWGSSCRIRMKSTAILDEHFNGMSFVPSEEWNANRSRWGALLGVSPERLEPGAELGPPRATLYRAVEQDLAHPFPGQVFAQKHVRSAITDAHFKGVEPWEVHFLPASPGESRSCASIGTEAPPKEDVSLTDLEAETARTHMWELFVTGKAWRAGSTLESLKLCGVCGRVGFPRPRDLTVDVTRWDGSDFFHVDMNPNIVLVTRRVRDLFEKHRFSNCTFVPI